MVEEALAFLALSPGDVAVDATLGQGGYAERLADLVGPEGRVVALDQDPAAIEWASRHLAPRFPNINLVHANFARLDEVCHDLGLASVDAVAMDLGLSSAQLAEGAGRGFSFQHDERLDGRMDTTRGSSVADVVARLDAEELAAVIRRYGDERYARRVARSIVRARASAPIVTTGRLAEIVRSAVPFDPESRIDPCTRTFQALRVYANRELECLHDGLMAAFRVLRVGGRLITVGYHSGEDRVAKQYLASAARGCTCPPTTPICVCGISPWARLLVRRPVRPSDAEVSANPRSRSARLRAAEKIGEPPSHGES
jgi:16S rRNA (cytosine1402-N4)-methyltransferase